MPTQNPRWLVMIYLSGDNNLSPEMVKAISDIAGTGLPESVGLTIQYDPSLRSLPTFRYYLEAGKPLKLKSHAGPIPLADYAEPVPDGANAASPQVLSAFITWSMSQARYATHRMLVLSGHGAGPIGDFLTDDSVPGRQHRSLSMPRLRDALHRAKLAAQIPERQSLLHILGMDSCLMSSVEVGYEVAEHVDYLVASEGFVPNAGWPYGHLLAQLKRKLAAGAGMDSGDVAGCIVADSVDYYTGFTAASISFDLAACELAKLQRRENGAASRPDDEPAALTDAIKQLAGTLSKAFDDQPIIDAVILAHWRAQSFKFEEYADLGDFCHLLADSTRAINVDVANAAGEVEKAINAVVGGRRGSAGVEFQHGTGLSVYFPWSLALAPPEYSNGRTRGVMFPSLKPYSTSRFAKATGWDDFLVRYLSATMRKPKRILGGRTIEQVIVDEQAQRPVFTQGLTKYIEGTNKYIEGTNKYIEGTNKYIEGTNKFQSGGGVGVRGSMKNPPQQVEVDPEKLLQLRGEPAVESVP
jgi:hypothetical protein